MVSSKWYHQSHLNSKTKPKTKTKCNFYLIIQTIDPTINPTFDATKSPSKYSLNLLQKDVIINNSTSIQQILQITLKLLQIYLNQMYWLVIIYLFK